MSKISIHSVKRPETSSVWYQQLSVFSSLKKGNYRSDIGNLFPRFHLSLRKATKLIYVGAGIVGLAASIGITNKGHKVTIVEATTTLQVIGDGIAVAANSQRVLKHYSILDNFYKRAKRNVGVMQHRRYSTSEVVSACDMTSQVQQYGYASYILSRPGYQRFLYEETEKRGVKFRFGNPAETVEDNATRPVLILKNGDRIGADLIVGADGVKSIVRKSIYPDIAISSEQNCYRASITLSKLQADPELSALTNTFDFWMGPQHLVIAGPSSDDDQYSMALYHPGNTGTAGEWKKPGDLAHMRETFKDFALPMRKILDLVDSSVVWKVVEVPLLPSWISKGGNVVVIGDAAHGMTPYQGQGAAMGIEDGAALAETLGRATNAEDIKRVLPAFEKIRKPRAELIAIASAMLGKIWQMPDGEAQQQRDERMKAMPIWDAKTWDGSYIDDVPGSLRDPNYQSWVMGHDTIIFTNRQLDKMLA
ncbi:FAD/NAD(P)-binding domain containing protein [Hyaloscypha variabilis]